MDHSKELRHARHRTQIRKSEGTYEGESEVTVEAGDGSSDGSSEGADRKVRFRQIIQHDHDKVFESNIRHATRLFEGVVDHNCDLPAHKQKPGQLFRGRFSPEKMFRPTWIKVYQDGEVKGEWSLKS